MAVTEDSRLKELNLAFRFQRATEDRQCVAGSCEVVEVKPELQWRLSYVVDASTIHQEKLHAWIRAGSRKKRLCVLQEQGRRDGITQALWRPDDSITIPRCLLNMYVQDLFFPGCISVSLWSDHSFL